MDEFFGRVGRSLAEDSYQISCLNCAELSGTKPTARCETHSPTPSCAGVCYTGDDSDSTTTINCTCRPGFVGDGFMCNAKTWLTLSELPAAKYFYRVILISANYTNFFCLYAMSVCCVCKIGKVFTRDSRNCYSAS